jgi:urea transport system substrate-binding protein
VGGGPEQQLTPAAGWAVGLLGKRRFFLVGSDYVYSRASNEILKDQLAALHAEVVGTVYVPLHEVGGAAYTRIAEQIKQSKAQAVFNTIDGNQANLAFFHALSDAGIKASEVPVISFSFSENELRNLNERDTVGHYAVGNYFESLATPANQEFLKRIRSRYPTRAIFDPMEAAYCGVYLWKQAVAEAGSDRPAAIRAAMAHQQFDGPEGLIRIDPATRHALRTARIGRVVNNHEFKVVFVSPEPLPASPFPATRTREKWQQFLDELYRKWGNRWEAPGE